MYYFKFVIFTLHILLHTYTLFLGTLLVLFLTICISLSMTSLEEIIKTNTDIHNDTVSNVCKLCLLSMFISM